MDKKLVALFVDFDHHGHGHLAWQWRIQDFPWNGGEGSVDSQGDYVSKILYVETKEARNARPLDPPMHGFSSKNLSLRSLITMQVVFFFYRKLGLVD